MLGTGQLGIAQEHSEGVALQLLSFSHKQKQNFESKHNNQSKQNL
jgi:hypothetical protein